MGDVSRDFSNTEGTGSTLLELAVSQQPGSPVKKQPWRVFAAGCIVVATASLLVVMFSLGLSDKYAANRDFIEYWAAGHQLLHGANPYDAAATLQLERSAGMQAMEPQVTLSPPFAFCFLVALGFFSAKTGLILWLLLLIGSLLCSIWMIWILNGRPDSGFHYCGYMFAPAVACLMLGQIGIFLLLGLVLFLWLHQRHPFLAGLGLLPCVWKPHLFLPFFIVLFLWSIASKQYRVVLGFCAAVLASCALTTYFDREVWSQYSRMMADTAGTLHGYVPTLSVTLRFLAAPHAVWLQYIPEAVACFWAIWYFQARRSLWNWMDQGSWVLLISAVCTPYAWFTDEAVLLPAVLYGVYRAARSNRSLLPIAVIAFVALTEVCAFGHIASTHYLWTVPAWIGWYIYATRSMGAHTQPIRNDAEAVVN